MTAQHYDYGAQAYVTDSTTYATVAYGYDDAGDRTSESSTTTVTPAGGSPVTTGQTTNYLVNDNNPTGYNQVAEEKGSPTGAPVTSYYSACSMSSTAELTIYGSSPSVALMVYRRPSARPTAT